VDTQLWQAHRAVITSAKSVDASERLLTAAQGTYEVAQGRYKAGVGSLLDLLTAQSALADGRRQRVAALVDRLTAATQLALAAGRTGF
jgi:outer membrane protein